MKVKIRAIYDPTEDKGIDCSVSPSLTKQAEKDACDVNLILNRFERTGVLPDMIRQDGRYGDFSDVGTYQEALNTVILAQEQFEALDAHVRDRFGNDPMKMLEFCSRSENLEEMVKLGLAVASPVTPSQPAATDSGAQLSGSQGAGAPQGASKS